jgi:hypothetical protein
LQSVDGARHYRTMRQPGVRRRRQVRRRVVKSASIRAGIPDSPRHRGNENEQSGEQP